MEITMPRIILSEYNTHRMFSRNSASSRAIPIEKMLQRVREDPYVPTHWGKNQKGMQADVEVDVKTQEHAKKEWLAACAFALSQAEILLKLGIHKQVTNRLLEPFMWHTAIVTSTEWSNFFNLRCNSQAHPEMQALAEHMQAAMANSKPCAVAPGQWHMPFVTDEEREIYKPEYLVKVAVGRCARVSYLTHDGKRELEKDVALHDQLLHDGHMSPFEHVAQPMGGSISSPCSQHVPAPFYGNLRGWKSYRKMIPHEDDILGAKMLSNSTV
jgi:thymidylate synthase ThyX